MTDTKKDPHAELMRLVAALDVSAAADGRMDCHPSIRTEYAYENAESFARTLTDRLTQAEQESTALNLTMDRQTKRIAELEAQLEAVGAGGVGALTDEDTRQRLGEALTEVLTDESAAEQPDWFDSREIDRVIDAIVPHVHPDYGPGLFFTEDAVITSPQPPRLALDRREPVVWIDFHADPTLRPLVSIGAKPPPLWPDAEPLYRAIVELPPPLQIAEPASQALLTDDLWYLQDSRQFVGNDVLWWAKDGKGYTTDVSKAHVYSREDAFRQAAMRDTDKAWPKSYIDGKTRPAVDYQYINRLEATKEPS